jgi:xanthine dehydrogenase YagR molybdenum-binding subunit
MTAAKRDAEPKTRMVRVHAGIVGAKVEEIEREVSADEPPPLGLNSELSVLGKRTPRIDGRLKVTGAAKYTADVRLPGMLFASMVTSPHPHARVLSIDTSAAAAHTQVRAVHILERVRDVAELRDKSKELPSKYPVVRFAGQPIAAVAATTQAAPTKPRVLSKSSTSLCPSSLTRTRRARQTRRRSSPERPTKSGTAGGGGGPAGVKQSGNVRGPVRRGKKSDDVEKGFKDADVIVEGEFRTQVQTHSALETHGVVADWKPEGSDRLRLDARDCERARRDCGIFS